MLSGPSFRSAFAYNINSVILSGFPLTSFHLVEALLSAFLWLYTLVCAVVQKYHKMYFYLHLFTFLVLISQSTCFISTTWKRTQTMEQQPPCACEQTKSKQKQNQVTLHSNWTRALLFDLSPKQCNGILKGWFHCRTPEWKRQFLVNNILMFGSAWCLVMAQIQFSLIKKLKIGRPEHWLTPHFPTSDNISILFYPPTPSKWTSYVYHP